MITELQFKIWFRDKWEGWLSSYESARGGTLGVADLQILVKGILVPVELKVGEVKSGKLFSDQIRASQVKWHRDLYKAGGYSIFAIAAGVGKTPDEIFLFNGYQGAMLQSAVTIKETDKISVDNFSSSLHDFLVFRMGLYQ